MDVFDLISEMHKIKGNVFLLISLNKILLTGASRQLVLNIPSLLRNPDSCSLFQLKKFACTDGLFLSSKSQNFL